MPRSRVYRILRRGEVRVNGKRVKPEYRLAAGDRLRVPPVRLDAAAEGTTRAGQPARHRTQRDRPRGSRADRHQQAGRSGRARRQRPRFWRHRGAARRQARANHSSWCIAWIARPAAFLLVARRRSSLRALHALMREGLVREALPGAGRGPVAAWQGAHRCAAQDPPAAER